MKLAQFQSLGEKKKQKQYKCTHKPSEVYLYTKGKETSL